MTVKFPVNPLRVAHQLVEIADRYHALFDGGADLIEVANDLLLAVREHASVARADARTLENLIADLERRDDSPPFHVANGNANPMEAPDHTA